MFFVLAVKQDIDAIVLEIGDIIQTYKTQLSQNDIQHLENIRQNDLITYISVLYSGNVTIPEGGHKFIVEGHKKLLEELNMILKDRNIKLD